MTDDLAKKKRNSFDDAYMMVNQTSSLTPGIAIFLSVLNFVLSITAFVGNTLILVALYKVPSIHPPTKLLFRCLSVTDLCVGLFLQPLFATRILNSATKIISPGNLFYFIEANASTHSGVFILEILENGTSFQQVQTLVEEKGVIISSEIKIFLLCLAILFP